MLIIAANLSDFAFGAAPPAEMICLHKSQTATKRFFAGTLYFSADIDELSRIRMESDDVSRPDQQIHFFWSH